MKRVLKVFFNGYDLGDSAIFGDLFSLLRISYIFCKNTLEVATATTRFIHKPEPITANHKHVQETKWKNPSLQKIENKTPSSTSKRNAKDQIQCHSCKFILPNCHPIVVEVGLVKVTTWRSTYPFFVAWEMLQLELFSWNFHQVSGASWFCWSGCNLKHQRKPIAKRFWQNNKVMLSILPHGYIHMYIYIYMV